MEINLGNLNNKELTDFLSILYNATELDHFVNDGKKYKECTNSWDRGNTKNREPHDKDRECKGDSYDDCTFRAKIRPIGNVIYKVNIKLSKLKSEDYAKLNEIFKDIRTVFKKDKSASINDIKLVGFDTIELKNTRGENDDHRGSTHCNLRVDYEDSYKLTKLNLTQLIVGLYRIKSHKFDKWYELFSDARISVKNGSNLVISCGFDHGS
jgi:hypothetical protein